MLKLKSFILEDEFYARENLKTLLRDYCPEIQIIGEAESAPEAKKLVYEKNPDVIFLDIQMPEMDGFEFLDSLSERNFSVVFVSAHMEYGVRAVKAHAVDFLLKPVSIKELQQCVNNLVQIHTEKIEKGRNKEKINSTSKIVLTNLQGFSVHDIDEIIRLEANDNYTKVFIKDSKTITISKPLRYFEESCGKSFFRIHKSHMINLKYLKEYIRLDGGYVVMSDGTKINISRRKLQEFLNKVKPKVI